MPAVNFRLAPALHQKLLALCEKRETTITKFYQELTERVVDHVDDLAYNPNNPPAGGVATYRPPIASKRLATSGIVGFHPVTGEPIEQMPAYGSRIKGPKKS